MGVEMVQQVIGEFEEKFQEKNLTMMVHFTDEPSIILSLIHILHL